MVRFISDDRKVDRTSKKPLLVIGAGVPRAATSSMQVAFEELGITPCLHMAQILPHVDRERTMIEAIREEDTARRQKLLHKLIDGHEAICDLPVIFFTTDLMDMYPDARLVLNARPSAEIWEKSCRDSLGFFFTWKFKWISMLWTTDRLWYAMNMEVIKWCKSKFDVPDPFSAKMYRSYYEDVREEATKRGREVLEFKAEDGWEPLCEFLGKRVPDKPFPRVNEAATFAVVKRIIVARGLFAWAALGGSWYAAWRFRSVLIGAVGWLGRFVQDAVMTVLGRT